MSKFTFDYKSFIFDNFKFKKIKMKGKSNAAKNSKQKAGIYMPYNQNSNSYNTSEKNMLFPIWEKIYLDLKSNIIYEDTNIKAHLEDNFVLSFFKESKSILIKNFLYIFPLYKSEYKYSILDLEKNQFFFQEMPYQCFHPVYSQKYFYSIFLFIYDTSFKSDGRYNIVEYNVKTNSFTILNSKGVPPKSRNNNFCSFIYSNKLYFFGGTQRFMSDNSLNYLFSFNLKENDWKIEEYNFNSDKEIINSNYIGNSFDISYVQLEEKNIFYLLGGKYYDDIIYSEINNINNPKLKQAKESNGIIKLQIKENGIIELINQKTITKNKLGQVFSVYHKDNIYIYNKDSLFLYDYKSQDISILKKRIFFPEMEGHGTIFIYAKFLYLVGKFSYFDDCFIFRTSLDKINIRCLQTPKANYEHLLTNINNSKDNNDILCEFNNPEEKKLYFNKAVLSNFSLNLKNQIYNISNNHKQQGKINLPDINYQTLLIIFKWIYNNFEDISNNLSNDTFKDILFILLKLKAISLLNIFISKININENNALLLYEFGSKHNLKNLMEKSQKYIINSIISKNNNKILSFNESNDIKKKIYENFFCEHKIYIECSVTNLNMHNLSMTNITNEKLDYIKQLNKNGKIFYCINCNKVFIPNNTIN